MSLKPLFRLMTLLLLSGCSTAAPEAQRFVGVPLAPWPAAEQKAIGLKIVRDCGNPPACAADQIVDKALLAYVKLRALVEAANKGGNP